MNQEKYTERAQGMIQSAQMLSLREGNQQLTPYHLLKVILDDAEGGAATILHHASANSRSLLAAAEGALAKLPKVSGDTGGVYLSQELAKVFEFAEKAAAKGGGNDITEVHAYHTLILVRRTHLGTSPVRSISGG